MEQHIAQVPERTLSAGLAMDAVSLRVGNLELMSDYYEQALALVPIEERVLAGQVHRVLGRGGAPLVRLIHTPDLPELNPRDAGLFHTAFLFADAASLAATVYRAAQDPRSRFAGSSDHLVSEAFYFTDPEGNGIELYVDRPREAWQYDGDEIRMDTLFLDPNAYLREHLDEGVLADAALQVGSVGHVHLQVGNVARAREFYVDALGFEATATGIPTALFASAGGYHHHVAMNVWNSQGAGLRAARLGLADVAITLPGREDLDALTARLRDRGLAFQDTGRAVVVADPWGTQVTLALPGASAEDLLTAS
ncbi:VOC family protein [Leucobacter aridicollis]|uniref:Catechol 2,3-dioxygenase n=1 Tax=Leucobacter aridicollis TaxID=283878 RepID=A0A852RAC6_9MICO|nr:VOC family protein [Leucobacter aridicollis]MBL3683652.1 VOC family protein [Leucobacter aridicollis]NYD28295.1 catechol 2,3-dioxygenase [Leucobacter aridicollis]